MYALISEAGSMYFLGRQHGGLELLIRFHYVNVISAPSSDGDAASPLRQLPSRALCHVARADAQGSAPTALVSATQCDTWHGGSIICASILQCASQKEGVSPVPPRLFCQFL
eukprot:4050037-Amphidinium_carterae.1